MPTPASDGSNGLIAPSSGRFRKGAVQSLFGHNRESRGAPHSRITAAYSPTLVALTGWGQEEDRRRSEEAGFDAHLVKPVDFAALTKLLAESGAD